MLLLALAALPVSARAQDYASASPPEHPLGDAGQADQPAVTPLDAEESAALGQALQFDPTAFGAERPAKPLHLPRLSQKRGLDASRTDNPDGSTAMVLKQPLPTEWDAKIGADLGLGPTAQSYQPDRPLPGQGGRNSGAAWASLGVTKYATIDARVDPTSEQSRLGTTFRHSIPVGRHYSVTLQDSYAFTDTFGQPTTGPAGLPLATLPQDTGAAAPSQVWSSEKQVKFNIASTGTTFGAGLATNSVDPVTHNTLSAEQKVYGPLQVTTAVSDVGQPWSNKSITAGFKLNW